MAPNYLNCPESCLTGGIVTGNAPHAEEFEGEKPD
jgi:hypothetical protein